jgi:DNA repair protein RecO (recombination protein O)
VIAIQGASVIIPTFVKSSETLAEAIKTKGIVLGHIKYGDSSIIVRIYTAAYGQTSFIVKGINAKKSKFKSALFQALTPLSIEMDYSQKRQLQYLKEANMLFTPIRIHSDIFRSTIALFMAEVISLAAREEEANQESFDFLLESIKQLDDTACNVLSFHIRFLTAYTKHLGFFPHDNYTESKKYFDLREGYFGDIHPAHSDVLMPPQSEHLSEVLKGGDTVEKLESAQRTELIDCLLHYYTLHLPGFGHLKSIYVLREVYR